MDNLHQQQNLKITEVNSSFDLDTLETRCEHKETIDSETNITNCALCGSYLGEVKKTA